MIYLKSNHVLYVQFGEADTSASPNWTVFYQEPTIKQGPNQIGESNSYEMDNGATTDTTAAAVLTGPQPATTNQFNVTGSSRRYKCRLYVCNRDSVARTLSVFIQTDGSANKWIANGQSIPSGGTWYFTEDGVIDVTGTPITSVIAGDGLSGGGSSGAVTLTVNVDGTSIDINADTLRRMALTGDVTASAGSGATTIGADKVLDTMLRNSNGLSVIGRSANSTGDPADIVAANDFEFLFRNGTSLGFGNFGSLTTVDPALTDEIPLSDASNSNANANTTVERLLGFGRHIVEGRLTLTSGTAVTTSDVTGAGTIYFTPFHGNRVRLFDGTRWKVYTFTERSLALSISSGSLYDVFLYDNSGTLTLELSAAWASATTRTDALTTQDGVYVKSGATTRLYLGTIYGSGSNTTEDSERKRFVWNAYNRVQRCLLGRLKETAGDADTTTTTSTTFVTLGSDYEIEAVCGLQEDTIDLSAYAMLGNNGSNVNTIAIAKGTATFALSQTASSLTATSQILSHSTAFYDSWLGYEKWFLSVATSGGTMTIYQDAGGQAGETATNDPVRTMIKGVIRG